MMIVGSRSGPRGPPKNQSITSLLHTTIILLLHSPYRSLVTIQIQTLQLACCSKRILPQSQIFATSTAAQSNLRRSILSTSQQNNCIQHDDVSISNVTSFSSTSTLTVVSLCHSKKSTIQHQPSITVTHLIIIVVINRSCLRTTQRQPPKGMATRQKAPPPHRRQGCHQIPR